MRICILKVSGGIQVVWKTMNFDWNRARAFLVTAEKGSYSAAAKELKLAQPTLGRQVAALEKELEVVLFERIGNGLELTPTGIELFEIVKSMGEAANRLSLSASGRSTDIEGSVCISASEAYAVNCLPSVLVKLRKLQPKINIDLIASNESSDLLKREADIAIRSYRPTQEDLIAKKISDSSFSLFASNDYIKEAGPFKEIEDLSGADFIGVVNTEEVVKGLRAYGINIDISNFPYECNSHIAHWELVKEGAGIGLMETNIGESEPGVSAILSSKLPRMEFENWLVSHRELKTNRRIKYVFDFLCENLKNQI